MAHVPWREKIYCPSDFVRGLHFGFWLHPKTLRLLSAGSWMSISRGWSLLSVSRIGGIMNWKARGKVTVRFRFHIPAEKIIVRVVRVTADHDYKK